MTGSNYKVLIVGGAGYIGSHMVKTLIDNRCDVLILDNLSTGHRRLIPGGNLIEGNLGDPVLLDQIFNGQKIDAVMHFAAFSQVGESVCAPLKYYQNNIAETITLLNAMIHHDVKRFIFSSTASVYGEPAKTPISEDHHCRPTNPYGWSKLAVERILDDCDVAHGIKSICLRYFNAAGADESGTIGEMHHPETHLIPLVLKCALTDSPIKVFGTDYPTEDGTCIRDYIHVTDLATAHLAALQALMEGSESNTFNLGNSIGYSVRQVIRLSEKATGKKIQVVEDARRPGDPAVLIARSEKIKRQLGWRPKYEDLETIIATAWKWHSRR